jgi:Na+/alanine symporter
MNGLPSPNSWQQKVFQAVLLLLLVAIGSRVIAEVVAPLVPALVVIALLCAVGWLVIGWRR